MTFGEGKSLCSGVDNVNVGAVWNATLTVICTVAVFSRTGKGLGCEEMDRSRHGDVSR